jgi:polyisoprenoid-binding protein YceI
MVMRIAIGTSLHNRTTRKAIHYVYHRREHDNPQIETWSAWHVDPAHSLVEFSVRHMMLSNVRGRFTGISGTVVDADEDPKRSSVKVAVDVTTLITGDPQRDEHLRSADFFDVAKYPSMTFESRRITGSRDKFTVTGDLTSTVRRAKSHWT